MIVKEYLVANKLADEQGKLICSNDLENPDWGYGPYNEWDTMIYLCTLVHFLNQQGILHNLKIALAKVDEYNYQINLDQIDKSYLHSFNWDTIIETIEYLIPFMAGSNVSYLAGGLFYGKD